MQKNTDIQTRTTESTTVDIAALYNDLKTALETIRAMEERHKREVNELNLRIKDLTAQVAYLKHQLYGRKSEKLAPYDPYTPDIFAGMCEEAQQEANEKRDEAVKEVEKQETKEDGKRKRHNRIMMENLPVLKTTVLEPKGFLHTSG